MSLLMPGFSQRACGGHVFACAHCPIMSRRCKLRQRRLRSGEPMPSIPLLTTDGDAHACGRAHGQRFAREIADNVATYLRRFAASGLDQAEAFVEAETWRKAIATQSPGYAEEMRGIAEGSGQSEQAIALLNARYELAFTLFGREATAPLVKTSELLDIGPDGCTTFGLEPTRDRRPPHLAGAELGLARRRARTHVRPAGAAKREAELRLPHRSRHRRRQDGRQ
jgi:hypothetical protein